jgi:hypothetical protein
LIKRRVTPSSRSIDPFVTTYPSRVIVAATYLSRVIVAATYLSRVIVAATYLSRVIVMATSLSRAIVVATSLSRAMDRGGDISQSCNGSWWRHLSVVQSIPVCCNSIQQLHCAYLSSTSARSSLPARCADRRAREPRPSGRWYESGGAN